MGLNTALTPRSNGRQRVYQVFLFLSQTLPNTQITMKVFMIAALCIAAVSADPWGYFGYGYGHPGLLKNPHLSWPGVVAPGFESTCFGCRGKRSADAEAEPHLGYYGYPYAYGYYPYALHLPKVAPIAKDGVAVHPGAATSFVSRSAQGARGKRSAEPWGYGYPYGFYGYPYHYGAGVAGHVGGGTSYVARSPQGLGK